MPRKLHGQRYMRPEAAELHEFVGIHLHDLSFDECLNFYNDFRKATKNPLDYAFLGCNDRFFLLSAILHRRDVLHPWLYARCREVEASPDGHLDLWARYHYKSTLITFAGSIQEVMRDPEITICIFSHTRDIAQDFLDQIKREFEGNEFLKAVFADVLYEFPRKQAPKWSEGDGLIVKRTTNPKECTIEAWGLVDGQPTGKHFKLLIYDDVVTLKSVTIVMAKKTTEAWEMSDNLGIGAGKTRVWTIGTRYKFGDTYGTMIERRIFDVRKYPATHNGKRDGDPVFMSRAEWEEVKKKQRSTVGAQMLQNPAEGTDAIFQLSWAKQYEVRPTVLNVAITVDPSGSRKRTSDRTAMIVTGIDQQSNKYLLDGFSHRMDPGDRWKNLRKLWIKWKDAPGVQNIKIGYEKYGMQADISVFEMFMREDKIWFTIEELNWVGPEVTSKMDRISRLQPDIEGVKFKYYFPSLVYSQEAQGICTWRYDTEQDVIETTLAEKEIAERDHDGRIRVIRGDLYETRLQKAANHASQPWRKARAIRQIDEEGQIYDLTMRFFEEMAVAPFGQLDDTLDAASRIYDAKFEFLAPKLIEKVAEHPIYSD